MTTSSSPHASVHDVAAGVLAALGRPTTAMTLEKLVYYVQAWHLADYGVPAFEESIEAWKRGPVVRDLYQEHRGNYSVATWRRGDVSRLSSTHLAVIDWVVVRYGSMSAEKLSRMTHAEIPWQVARAGLPDSEPSAAPIDRGLMRTYYARQRADASSVVDMVSASAALTVFDELHRDDNLIGRRRASFAERLAYSYGEINARHVFREGNGRAQRAFLRQLSAAAGWRLDWSLMSKRMNDEACRANWVTGDVQVLVDVLGPAISRI